MAKSKAERAVEAIIDCVNDEIKPANMSADEALETVEMAIDEMKATAAGLRDDLEG